MEKVGILVSELDCHQNFGGLMAFLCFKSAEIYLKLKIFFILLKIQNKLNICKII